MMQIHTAMQTMMNGILETRKQQICNLTSEVINHRSWKFTFFIKQDLSKPTQMNLFKPHKLLKSHFPLLSLSTLLSPFSLPSQSLLAAVFTINLSQKVNIWLKSFPECFLRWSLGTISAPNSACNLPNSNCRWQTLTFCIKSALLNTENIDFI